MAYEASLLISHVPRISGSGVELIVFDLALFSRFWWCWLPWLGFWRLFSYATLMPSRPSLTTHLSLHYTHFYCLYDTVIFITITASFGVAPREQVSWSPSLQPTSLPMNELSCGCDMQYCALLCKKKYHYTKHKIYSVTLQLFITQPFLLDTSKVLSWWLCRHHRIAKSAYLNYIT